MYSHEMKHNTRGSNVIIVKLEWNQHIVEMINILCIHTIWYFVKRFQWSRPTAAVVFGPFPEQYTYTHAHMPSTCQYGNRFYKHSHTYTLIHARSLCEPDDFRHTPPFVSIYYSRPDWLILYWNTCARLDGNIYYIIIIKILINPDRHSYTSFFFVSKCFFFI